MVPIDHLSSKRQKFKTLLLDQRQSYYISNVSLLVTNLLSERIQVVSNTKEDFLLNDFVMKVSLRTKTSRLITIFVVWCDILEGQHLLAIILPIVKGSSNTRTVSVVMVKMRRNGFHLMMGSLW